MYTCSFVAIFFISRTQKPSKITIKHDNYSIQQIQFAYVCPHFSVMDGGQCNVNVQTSGGE